MRQRESVEGRREREGRDMRQERKIYFLYEKWVQSSSLDRVGGREDSGNLLLCSFKMEGRRKKKKNEQNESSPIQLGEGTSTLRQGFIQEGIFSLSGWKKFLLLFSLCDAFCWVYRWNVGASLCMQQVNWKVCPSYMLNPVAPLTCCKRGVIFLSSFLHSLLCCFSPNISPWLPSSHPNQRTHRPLLGTPCPGSPPCTARYLRNTNRRKVTGWLTSFSCLIRLRQHQRKNSY